MVKKEDIFIRFDTMHERDRHTDKQTVKVLDAHQYFRYLI